MVVPPFHTPKWSFLVGKPIFVGYHHFRKLPEKSTIHVEKMYQSHWSVMEKAVNLHFCTVDPVMPDFPGKMQFRIFRSKFQPTSSSLVPLVGGFNLKNMWVFLPRTNGVKPGSQKIGGIGDIFHHPIGKDYKLYISAILPANWVMKKKQRSPPT